MLKIKSGVLMRLFIILLCLLSFVPIIGHANDFTVENIAVDVEGENAINARDNALAKARRDAFRVLTRRLLTDDELASLPKIDDDKIAVMVENFEINREKLSKNRYLASLNITFNQRAVYGYLGRFTTIAMPDTYESTVVAYETDNPSYNNQPRRLILPWYGRESDITLWKDSNPWRDAWVTWSKTPQARDMNIIVPMGDITDIQTFNPEKPLSYDNNALERLLNRYNAGQAIIAMADPLPTGMVRVSLYQTTTLNPRFIERIVAPAGPIETGNMFYPALYKTTQTIMDTAVAPHMSLANQLPSEDIPSFAIDNTLSSIFEAEVKIANIQQWIGIKQSLNALSGMSDLQVKSLSAGRAIITFRYSGNADTLRRDMQARGLGFYANPVQMSGSSPYIITRQNS